MATDKIIRFDPRGPVSFPHLVTPAAVVSSDTHPSPYAANQSVGETRRSVIHDLEARLRDDRPDLFEQLRQNARRPTFRDHVADALHDPLFTFILGGFVGVGLTCVSAMVWAGVVL